MIEETPDNPDIIPFKPKPTTGGKSQRELTFGVRHLSCLCVFYSVADNGLTNDELQSMVKISPNGSRRRRQELAALGLLEDSGLVRPTKYGRNATVWRITEEGMEMIKHTPLLQRRTPACHGNQDRRCLPT